MLYGLYAIRVPIMCCICAFSSVRCSRVPPALEVTKGVDLYVCGCLFRFSVWVVAIAVPIADTKESAASRDRHPLLPPETGTPESAAPVSPPPGLPPTSPASERTSRELHETFSTPTSGSAINFSVR